jgi:hypothetical protein
MMVLTGTLVPTNQRGAWVCPTIHRGRAKTRTEPCIAMMPSSAVTTM